eukprot:199418-Pyramimonas_sp.AAC.1
MDQAKELEAGLEAIRGLSTEWAKEQRMVLSESLQRLRAYLHAAKPLHAQAHILANKVRQQKIKS